MKTIKTYYADWCECSPKQQRLLLLDYFIIAWIAVDIFFLLNTIGAMDIDAIHIVPAIFILIACMVSLYCNCYIHNSIADVWNDMEMKESQHTTMVNIIADDMDDEKDGLYIM